MSDTEWKFTFYDACRTNDHETILEHWDELDEATATLGLSRACYYGTIDTVRLLLEHPNANPHEITRRCPLFGAIDNDDPVKLELLIEAGDEPFDLNTMGEFPTDTTLFWNCCVANARKCVKLLLSEKYLGMFDPNTAKPSRNETPLFLACFWGRVDLVRFMTGARYRHLWDYDTLPLYSLEDPYWKPSFNFTMPRWYVATFAWFRSWKDERHANTALCFQMAQHAKNLVHQGLTIPYGTQRSRSSSSSSMGSSSGSSSSYC